jgi:host factor-I protein
LECEGKQLMVYKHAISTITPAKSVFFSFSDKKHEEQPSNIEA